jgi:hypothetical protein
MKKLIYNESFKINLFEKKTAAICSNITFDLGFDIILQKIRKKNHKWQKYQICVI